jgi:Lar family restriction alleviation protein
MIELARIAGPRLQVEIRPCPFCGGEPIVSQNPYDFAPRVGSHVACRECGIRTPEVCRQTGDDAARAGIELWNKRVGIDPVAAGIMTEDEIQRRDEIFSQVRNGRRSVNWAREQLGLPQIEETSRV